MDSKELSEKNVTSISKALLPIRLWIVSAVSNIGLALIQAEVFNIEQQLSIIQSAQQKLLDTKNILSDPNDLNLLVSGLLRIIKEEVGEPAVDFTAIAILDPNKDENEVSIGNLVSE